MSLGLISFTACGRRETPVEAGLRTQTLHQGIRNEPLTLDPHLATQSTDYHILSALYEGLVSEHPEDLHPVPGVAERWDISPDGLVYTFHLRATARWSNGDPVTARDFADSIQRTLHPAFGSPNAPLLYVLQGAQAFNHNHNQSHNHSQPPPPPPPHTGAVAPHLDVGCSMLDVGHSGRSPAPDFSQVGVRVLNENRTLRLTLEHPSPTFLTQLNHPAWFPVHRASIEADGKASGQKTEDATQPKSGDLRPLASGRSDDGEAAAATSAYLDRASRWARPGRLVGNGPFVLDEHLIGQRITVKKSPTYWDAATVTLNAIQFHPIESLDAEERAFRGGQLHLTDSIPLGRIDAYRRDNPRLLRIDPYLAVEFYRVNITRPFLSETKIRRALALAIDRETLASQVLRGVQLPAATLIP
ncbi:peptide ABC transporter substrate-binding protein, partial [Geminisphaera colitermitum]|uniref:peptide ABC transporter substrate-binding protein n=1 Tax=Geminisphaera colitermitum TaxID=1148786 RepID=UPI0018E3CC80